MQGDYGKYESRIGSGSREVGVAAAALMRKANWHAFNLLVDTTLLPLHHLFQDDKNGTINLTPRNVVHLPSDDKTLRFRLRRIAEEAGVGGVIVMGCDLKNARYK